MKSFVNCSLLYCYWQYNSEFSRCLAFVSQPARGDDCIAAGQFQLTEQCNCCILFLVLSVNFVSTVADQEDNGVLGNLFKGKWKKKLKQEGSILELYFIVSSRQEFGILTDTPFWRTSPAKVSSKQRVEIVKLCGNFTGLCKVLHPVCVTGTWICMFLCGCSQYRKDDIIKP